MDNTLALFSPLGGSHSHPPTCRSRRSAILAHSPAAALLAALALSAQPSASTAPKTARPPAVAVPQILSASVTPTVVGSGSVVSARVRTTPGVISVIAHAGGTSMAVPRVGPGLFAGSTTLPFMPSFVRGSYAVTFVARDGRGASTQSAVGVNVR